MRHCLSWLMDRNIGLNFVMDSCYCYVDDCSREKYSLIWTIYQKRRKKSDFVFFCPWPCEYQVV